jgi:sugar lactone lactonase YvrE
MIDSLMKLLRPSAWVIAFVIIAASQLLAQTARPGAGVAPATAPKLRATIYVTNSNSVTAYAPGSSGNVKPMATLGGLADGVEGDADSGGQTITTSGQTGLRESHGIALDRSGKIYVANGTGAGSITVFPAGSSGNIAPIATIEGSDTGIDNPLGVAVDSHGKIFITNGAETLVTKENRLAQGPSSITYYASGSNGDVKPIATITGVRKSYVPRSFTGWEYFIPGRGSQDQLAEQWEKTVAYFERVDAYDSAQRNARYRQLQTQQRFGQTGATKPGPAPVPVRKLFVWNQDGPNDGVPHLSMYAIGSDGNVTRSIIADSACLLDFSVGLAVDSSGNLYMPPSECFGGNVETVIVGPADSAANKKQTITITGSAGSARGIAVDKGGNIYVTNSAVVNNSVTVYPAGGSGEVRPIANIAGHSTLLNGPGAIALDSSGKIYVANSGGSVTVYPVGSNGDVSPSATISGSSTGLDHPTGIAVDSDDNIYVTTEEGGSDRNGSVNIYRAGSNGNVAPIATISGTSTGLDRPEGIALGPPMRNP